MAGVKAPAVVAALALLAGCNEVVSTKQVETREETRTISCHHMGYCFKLAPDPLDMSFRLRWGLHAACPGTQKANVQISKMRLQFQDGTVRDIEQVKVVKELEKCQ